MDKILFLFLIIFLFSNQNNLVFSKDEIDQLPEYPGGEIQLLDFLNRHSNAPFVIVRKSEHPPVIMELEISDNGVAKVIQSHCPSNPEFADSLRKAFPVSTLWSPGIKNNQKVSARITLEIFYLPEYEAALMGDEVQRLLKQDDLYEQEGRPYIAIFLIGFIIIVLAFLLTRISFNYNKSKGLESMHNTGGRKISFFRQQISVWEEKVLLNNFKFYKTLSIKSRRKFADRVVRFIQSKTFEGRHGLEVTQTMQLLIAATAVRITFGLKTYQFPSFHRFLIFPEAFYSKVSGRKVRGETHGMGVIAFSWSDYLFGLADDNDNLNLGYHEFAHALFIERFKNNIDNRFMDRYDEWRKMVLTQSKMKEAKLKKTFRNYASYNEHEFFAVAVENFFELPEKFKNDLPELYQMMTRMMNQDPLATV